jgi:hypothetical protein
MNATQETTRKNTQETTRKNATASESDPTKIDRNELVGGETSLVRNATHTPPESNPTKTDRNEPAGSETSLGAERGRDGRPTTDDGVVAAMDEETPGLVGN